MKEKGPRGRREELKRARGKQYLADFGQNRGRTARLPIDQVCSRRRWEGQLQEPTATAWTQLSTPVPWAIVCLVRSEKGNSGPGLSSSWEGHSLECRLICDFAAELVRGRERGRRKDGKRALGSVVLGRNK